MSGPRSAPADVSDSRCRPANAIRRWRAALLPGLAVLAFLLAGALGQQAEASLPADIRAPAMAQASGPETSGAETTAGGQAAKPEEPCPPMMPLLAGALAGILVAVAFFVLRRRRARQPEPEAPGAREPAPEASAILANDDAPKAETADSPSSGESIPRDESSEPVLAAESQKAGSEPLTIESVVRKLVDGGAASAVFISPEGDEAAASAIMVARETADLGLRVALVDLTASGAASRPMLDDAAMPGITDLLADEARFSDVIHADHYSNCHILPVGTADPVRAMRAANRLPAILHSLARAYDLVVVECGPADLRGVGRLGLEGAEVFVSVLRADDIRVGKAAAAFRSHFPDAALVGPGRAV